MPIAAAIPAIIGAAGAVGGGLIGSSAAGKAADAQAQAAMQSAQLQYQASQNALQFQKDVWNQTQANQLPFLQAGQGAVSNLANLMGITTPSTAPLPASYPVSYPSTPNAAAGAGTVPAVPPQLIRGGPVQPATGSPGDQALQQMGIAPNSLWGRPLSNSINQVVQQVGQQVAPSNIGIRTPGAPLSPIRTGPGTPGFGSLMQPWTQPFNAPTNITETNDPGYQFRLQQGLEALQRSAAAQGNLLTGGTLKDLTNYAQNYASGEYQNVYNRALTEYQQAYNIFEQNQANQYNRLANMAGMGQTTAGTLGSQGLAAGQEVASNLLGTAAGMGQAYQGAGAARASGYIGGANAWTGALGNLANIGQQLGQLYMPQPGVVNQVPTVPYPTGTYGMA